MRYAWNVTVRHGESRIGFCVVACTLEKALGVAKDYIDKKFFDYELESIRCAQEIVAMGL